MEAYEYQESSEISSFDLHPRLKHLVTLNTRYSKITVRNRNSSLARNIQNEITTYKNLIIQSCKGCIDRGMSIDEIIFIMNQYKLPANYVFEIENEIREYNSGVIHETYEDDLYGGYYDRDDDFDDDF